MAWVSISNSAIDQDSPITVSLITALRDNPAAIANGDAGAPEIQNAALADNSVNSRVIAAEAVTANELALGAVGMRNFPAPTAESTYILWRYRHDRENGSSTADASGTYTFSITRSGELRIYAIGDSSSTVTVRVNGSTVSTLSTYTTTTSNTYDVAVASGDTLTISYSGVDETEFIDTRIYCGYPFPFYAVQMSGDH